MMVITTEPMASGRVRLRSENREVMIEVTIEMASSVLNRPLETLIEQFSYSSGYISGSFMPR